MDKFEKANAAIAAANVIRPRKKYLQIVNATSAGTCVTFVNIDRIDFITVRGDSCRVYLRDGVVSPEPFNGVANSEEILAQMAAE